ncbi:putative serine protease K12H4.7 isoform X2 [Hydra vulgaris]|uniref:Serine protease K12H4.7 isoform X2 n=1 Tax=Hydra vulgaris TaxID=6087 RepID=A0ABM4B3M8_HYDVU
MLVIKVTSLLLLLTNLSTGDDHIPLFINGRPKGGFMGTPKVKNQFLLNDIEPQWFTQKLNHFDEADDSTWKQRYYVNDEYFDGGPVFLMIGGEGSLSSLWVNVGAMVDYAKQHGALILGLEHRFYGESHPLSDMSTENLKYLSSEQALADLAYFRNEMALKYSLNDKNRWIAFGGSYPGALAAWLRYKYQHLIYGAVASSAPIYAQLNFPQYLEVSTKSLGSSRCRANVNAATKILESYLTTEEGLKKLSMDFKTCKPITNDLRNIQNFANNAANNFFGVIQYNKDNREFEGAIGTNITIDVLCGIMSDTQLGDPYIRYVAVNNLIMNTYQQKCLDVSYEDYVESMKETDWGSSAAEGGRQWLYQTCTEFGYYQTTDSIKQVFGNMFPLDFFLKQCVDIFGDKFNESSISQGINWTNTNYGGYQMNAKRIVFPNGSIDPWHALSFTKNAKDMISVFINGTAHCANMYPSSPDDSAELIKARQFIGDLITKWLVAQQ